MNVIPFSKAAWIVLIAFSSSVPPHMVPPMAHVPNPILEASISVLEILICSIIPLLTLFLTFSH